MLLELVNRISSERKVKKRFRCHFRTSKKKSGVISGRPQDVRLGRSREGQIGTLGDVLGTLEGNVFETSWGPIFAVWVRSEAVVQSHSVKKVFLEMS